MSDLFGGAAPAPAPAKRRAAAAPAPREPAAAAPAAPPEPAPARPPAAPQGAPAARGVPMLLHDGRQVDSWSEDWRLETLARWVLAMPFDARGPWIYGMPSEAARQALKERIFAIRQARRVSQAGD